MKVSFIYFENIISLAVAHWSYFQLYAAEIVAGC